MYPEISLQENEIAVTVQADQLQRQDFSLSWMSVVFLRDDYLCIQSFISSINIFFFPSIQGSIPGYAAPSGIIHRPGVKIP